MYKLKIFIKRLFTPITIMIVPHTDRKPLNLKVPSIGVFAMLFMSLIGMLYVSSIAIDAVEYRMMKEKLAFYRSQFLELRSSLTALKSAEREFRRLFSLGSKEQVLENLDTSNSGEIEDIEALKEQIKIAIERVGSIRDYLSEQRDIYLSTPQGWPVMGELTSGFGNRIHPISGEVEFHSGFDISASPGTPVKATADGIVSFADWAGANGNLVVIEHGLGYSTFYAHNKSLLVKVGQRVKRGDIIAYLGSTGSATGPHLHYEIWQNGRPVNPQPFISAKGK